MIGELIASDHAYLTDDGVYMSVESVDDYGLLAHQSVDDMRSGGGEREVFGAEQKRHPADFVLWKFSKPDEPSWPSPWGDGRPGWHSECVVMSLDLLGEGFDLHCGGQDLRFPHHENERAQAVALGKTFANHWMHNGFVVDAEGEKMSKSLGNVSNLLDLIELYDPRAYRMVLLQSHYRSPVKITQDNIDAAGKSLAGLDAFAARTASLELAAGRPGVLAEFREAMDDDLDTPRATALLFDTVRRANAALDGGDDDGGEPRRCRARDRRHVRPGAGRRRRGRRRGAGQGACARRRPRREGLRHGRRSARRTAGGRVDGGDDPRRHVVAAVTSTLDTPSSEAGQTERRSSTGRSRRPSTSSRRWGTSRRSTGCGRCRSVSSCSTTPASRGCTAGSSASRSSSSSRDS